MKKFLIAVMLMMMVVGPVYAAPLELSKLPTWDSEVVDAKWAEGMGRIAESEAEVQAQVMLVAMTGVEPSEADIKDIRKLFDEFTYWKALAQLNYYHSRFSAANDAVEKAVTVMKSVGAVIEVMGMEKS